MAIRACLAPAGALHKKRIRPRAVDSAAPAENAHRPAEKPEHTSSDSGGGPVHVPHRRLENSLREFPTLPTGATTADDFHGAAAEQAV
ncbi:MAG: hypothetical protein AMXMBFR56_77550 [Polyangiaceae bacterium]